MFANQTKLTLRPKEADKSLDDKDSPRFRALDLPYLSRKPTDGKLGYPTCMMLTHASRFNKIAHKLRLAVYEGGSSNLNDSEKLRQAVTTALEQQMPRHVVYQIIERCDEKSDGLNVYLLQIRFQRKVLLICTAQTRMLAKLKSKMMALLEESDSAFAHTMHMFSNYCLVEAIVPFSMNMHFDTFEATIARDAKVCKAKCVEIVDYETGAINFLCDPSDLVETCIAIEKKGYKVLHTENVFRPKKVVHLTEKERADFDHFMQELRKFTDIEYIYDNVGEEEDVCQESN